MNRAAHASSPRGSAQPSGPAALLLALTVSGCAANARDAYEPVLQYSAGHRGYVAVRRGAHAADDLAHDLPVHEGDYLILLHPITRKKLQCAEDIAPFTSTVAQSASRSLEETRKVGVSLTALFPITVAGGALIAVGGGLIGIALGPYWFSHADQPPRLTALGTQAYDAGDEARAISLLGLCAATDPVHARTTLTLYELGRAYARSRRSAESALALSTFVEQAIVWNRNAYDDAERQLTEFQVPRR